MSTETGSIPVAPTNTGQQVAGDDWHPFPSCKPEQSGRYAIVYKYKNLRPQVFTGDWEDSEQRWLSIPAESLVLYWMPYRPIPEDYLPISGGPHPC